MRTYCIVLGKRLWVLAAQAQKIVGGPLHNQLEHLGYLLASAHSQLANLLRQ